MKSLRTAASLLLLLTAGFAFGQESTVPEEIAGEMVSVKGGTFYMGSTGYEKNESPVRQVTVGDFYMLSHEVKQKEYLEVAGINYSAFRGSEKPVEEVSWYDAVVFCNKLSLLSDLVPCYSLNGETDCEKWGPVPRINDENLAEEKSLWDSIQCDFSASGYRLPTEAEWEYAASAGKESLYAGSDSADEAGWYKENAEGETKDCCLKKANDFNLYDLSGNVWEWCWDWYSGLYNPEDADNPAGGNREVTGKRIRRGGSFKSEAEFLRNANRASSVPCLRGTDLGFRVVRTAESERQDFSSINLFEAVENAVNRIESTAAAEVQAEMEENLPDAFEDIEDLPELAEPETAVEESGLEAGTESSEAAAETISTGAETAETAEPADASISLEAEDTEGLEAEVKDEIPEEEDVSSPVEENASISLIEDTVSEDETAAESTDNSGVSISLTEETAAEETNVITENIEKKEKDEETAESAGEEAESVSEEAEADIQAEESSEESEGMQEIQDMPEAESFLPEIL